MKRKKFKKSFKKHFKKSRYHKKSKRLPSYGSSRGGISL